MYLATPKKLYSNKLDTLHMLLYVKKALPVKVQRHHLVVEGVLLLLTLAQQVRAYMALEIRNMMIKKSDGL